MRHLLLCINDYIQGKKHFHCRQLTSFPTLFFVPALLMAFIIVHAPNGVPSIPYNMEMEKKKMADAFYKQRLLIIHSYTYVLHICQHKLEPAFHFSGKATFRAGGFALKQTKRCLLEEKSFLLLLLSHIAYIGFRPSSHASERRRRPKGKKQRGLFPREGAKPKREKVPRSRKQTVDRFRPSNKYD